jgi:hypothetical protein
VEYSRTAPPVGWLNTTRKNLSLDQAVIQYRHHDRLIGFARRKRQSTGNGGALMPLVAVPFAVA